jgi:crossover junction endodeoxyribonuclease RusA
MDWYMPDNIKADLTNKAESVMDLLVDCKVIDDDCWQVIPRIMLDCRGIDKEKPRVVVWIKYNTK